MNIYDIAQKSGVSIATVSRVLNGSDNVRDKTRQKVLAVMEQEDYTPNAFARGLGLNSMNLVGILCTDIADPFYAKAVSLLENALRERGLTVLLYCTGSRLEEKKRYLHLLLDNRVDAVLLVGSAFKEREDNSHIEQAAAQVPVVILNGLVELPNVYCVLCDERRAMEQTIAALLDQGCRRILYLYDVLTYSGSSKLNGYRDAYTKAGMELPSGLAIRVEKDLSTVRETVLRLLEENPDAFDAVAASEDLLAVGALKALQSSGRTLPIVGFNNSLLSQCTTPTLTSVDNMLDTLCPTAVNLLGDVLAGKEVPSQITLSHLLVRRETF